MNLPYLIQRVHRRKTRDTNAKGEIDAVFSFDYMGSSEFEFGALPKALKAMREAKIKAVEEIFDPTSEKRCFMVGASEAKDVATALFIDQLKPLGERIGRTKERAELHEAYFSSKQQPAWNPYPMHSV